MTRIGIIGAGVAGCAAAYALGGSEPEVTVLETTDRVGGRAATRHRGAVTYDYGANYIKNDDDRVVELLTETLESDGLVDITEPIWTFDGDGTVSEGRTSDKHKWTYRTGIAGVASRLLDAAGVDVELDTTVVRVDRADAGWRLRDSDGIMWGPFDAIVLTPPAPRTDEIVSDAAWEGDVRPGLTSALAAVPYRSIWTAILGYEFPLDVPWYALVNPEKDHEIGWISREECKPGHVPDGHTVLVVQANHAWSVAHAEDPADSNIKDLTTMTQRILDDLRLTTPAWTDHRAWDNALAEDGMDGDLIDEAAAAALYFAGDWVVGEARVHAALRSGLETGHRIAAEE